MHGKLHYQPGSNSNTGAVHFFYLQHHHKPDFICTYTCYIEMCVLLCMMSWMLETALKSLSLISFYFLISSWSFLISRHLISSYLEKSGILYITIAKCTWFSNVLHSTSLDSLHIGLSASVWCMIYMLYVLCYAIYDIMQVDYILYYISCRQYYSYLWGAGTS